MTIRTEKPTDYTMVAELIERAFETMEYSDHREHLLVQRLRKSSAFVPNLSLVMEKEEKIVGYVLLTKIRIGNHPIPVLALAPLAVHPDCQKQGIGNLLMQEAHQRAKVQGYAAIVLLGHAAYYTRFGYQPIHLYQIQLPFDAPPEHSLIFPLQPSLFQGISGLVQYDAAFFE